MSNKKQKDPAFLWYWNDWSGGTSTFTRVMKGCYMDLLNAQFNQGPLSLDEIKVVLGPDFGLWSTIQKKFKQDANGLFFNERMVAEQEKRKKFTDSRRENVSKRYPKPTREATSEPTTLFHMVNENEKEFTGTSNPKEGLLGENLELPQNVLEAVEQQQFTYHQKKNTEFVYDMWGLFLIERKADPPLKKARYHSLSDYTEYFINWMRNKHPQKNGTHQQSLNGSGAKLGTSAARVDVAKNW